MVVLAVATIFTLIQIHYSMDRGRLAQPPTYDDVGYFTDALDRLDSVYQDGWRQLVTDYMHSPPHSPWSSGMALAGFAIFGIHPWAPYAMNGLAVAGLLACVMKLTGGMRPLQRMAAAFFVLTVPLSANLVTEFRPDIVCGVAAAMAVILPLRQRLVGSTIGHRLAAGAFLALALLAKPPIFPLTLMTVGLAWVFAIACDAIDDQAFPDARKLAATLGGLMLPAMVSAVPHYLLNAGEIIPYIHQNTASPDARFWEIPGGWRVQAGYYLFSGPMIGVGTLSTGGAFMLGQHLFIMLTVLLVAVVVLIGTFRSSRRSDGDRSALERLSRATALVAVALVAYAVPAVLKSKNTFFASEFDALLILGSVMAARMLVVNCGRWHIRCVGTAMLIMMTIWGFCAWHMPSFWALSGGEIASNTNRVVDSIDRILFDHARPGAHVFVTAGGPVSHATLNYLSRQDGKRLDVTDLDLTDDLTEYRTAIGAADLVVAAEPGVAEFTEWHPSTKILGTTLKMVLDDDAFELIGAVPSRSKKQFFIFQREAFGGWDEDTAKNLTEAEGPYPPPMNLPKVRWALYPAATFTVHAATPGAYRFLATGRSPAPEESLSVLVDGQQIGSYSFAGVDVFQRMELPMDLAAGDHKIELQFDKYVESGPGDPRQRAVLFSTLRIEPVIAVPTTTPSGG
jgi:hypothetical protein